MSMLEVLHSCPSQRKALLNALVTVDPSNDHLIVFPIDTSKHPLLPPSVSFQIPVRVPNAIISRCIIDEGATTYMMSILFGSNSMLGSRSPAQQLKGAKLDILGKVRIKTPLEAQSANHNRLSQRVVRPKIM